MRISFEKWEHFFKIPAIKKQEIFLPQATKVVKEQFEYSRAADRHGSFKRLLLSALAFQ